MATARFKSTEVRDGQRHTRTIEIECSAEYLPESIRAARQAHLERISSKDLRFPWWFGPLIRFLLSLIRAFLP
jgi:hypothetical protein